MKVFKLIVAGGRKFKDYHLLKRKLDAILQKKSQTHIIEIVSGEADGADSLGEAYARINGYKVIPFPAKWEDLTLEPCKIVTRKNGTQYNALAGHNRNLEMAEYADALVLFWDGKSTGSKNMKDLALKLKLDVRVIQYS